jgi:glycosyltransferase involved in cell wall biosynthesis
MGNIETLKPLVSVIMSVYNAEQWLKIAIDSIVNQTYTNWEFFIIDDASTDTTQKSLHHIRTIE